MRRSRKRFIFCPVFEKNRNYITPQDIATMSHPWDPKTHCDHCGEPFGKFSPVCNGGSWFHFDCFVGGARGQIVLDV
jgi:hypothetical protein